MVADAGSRRPLPRSFYERDTTIVARALLGTILECETPDGRATGRIVETEAYLGPKDPASHASAGLTARTRHLFGDPGMAYVYFVYGVHWCVNAVTNQHGASHGASHGAGHDASHGAKHGSERGAGTAVLIRALEPVDGVTLMRARRWGTGDARHTNSRAPANRTGPDRRDRELTNGPGKLCEALGIDGCLNGVTLQRPPLTIRRGREIPDAMVLVSPRIGITRAADLPARFYIRDNPFVSRTPGGFASVKYRG